MIESRSKLTLLQNISHHMRVMAFCFRMSVQRQLEYPLFLFSFLLMVPLQYLTGLLILKVLVEKFQPLGGWTFPELTFLYGLGLLSHALVVIFFMPTWQIDDAVIHGQFDRYLVRPLNVFFHYCFSSINIIGFIDLIPAVILFLTGCAMVGFPLTGTNLFFVFVIVVGATLIRAAIYMVLGSVAFWTKRSRPLIMMGLTVMDRTTQFPINVYPYLLQIFLTFLVPIAFINFIPASYLLQKDGNFSLPGESVFWTPVIGGFCFLVAHLFFRLGLSRYESSGS